MLGELLAGVGQARLGDGEALADLDRGRFVVHADELESHEEMNLCIPLK